MRRPTITTPKRSISDHVTLERDISGRRPQTIAVLLALVGIVGLVLAVGLQRASADPASGVGKLTVDESGHWFEYEGNGEPYFMAGSGGPEGFLYYSDTRKQSIVNQLIDNDVRAIYIHAVRSDGGDGGGDENPFFGNDPDNGVDPAVLDDWDSYLSQLDDAGIVTWFHLYDDGARPYGVCNPDLPTGEKQFIQTMVERFRDYQHLVWLPTEEHIIKACGNNDTDVEKAKSIAAEIRKHDDVHPVGVHHNNGQSNQYLGNNDIDVFSQQVCQQSRFTSVDGIHDAGEFGEDVYVMAECHPWHKDLLDDGQQTTLRQSFWASVMAGGYVLFYDAWESNDPTDGMLADLGRINAFMDTTRFAETVPADQLAAAGSKWVLGNEAKDVYIAYSNENPSSMGIQGMSAGTYDLGWFDAVSGQRVSQTVTIGDGTAVFPVPNQIGSEVALSIEPSGDNPVTTTTVQPGTTTTTVPVTTTTEPPTTTVVDGPKVDLSPTDDAYLQGSTGLNNTEIRLEHGGRSRVGFLRFDTSGLTSAASVTLQVTIGNDPGSGTMAISVGDGGSWTEDTLTGSNAPSAGDILDTKTGTFTPGQQVTFNVPPSIIGGDVVDLVITHDGVGSKDTSLASSETGSGPMLIVNADEPVTTTTTPGSVTTLPIPTTTPPATEPPTTGPPTTTGPTVPPTTLPDGPGIATVTFNGTNAAIANPERGFHEGASVKDSTGGSNTSASQLASMRIDGVTLVRMYIRLDDYRNRPIPDELINNLDDVFGNVREAGIKIIPRFSYNFGSAPDASAERIEQHIEQVTPVIRRNSDVIAVMQAGFIGRLGRMAFIFERLDESNGSRPGPRRTVRSASR